MNAAAIVRAAIPQADNDLVDHVLWGRTCFPFGRVTARDLYRAASRLARAQAGGHVLCDLCDNRALPTRYTCQQCAAALAQTRSHDD